MKNMLMRTCAAVALAGVAWMLGPQPLPAQQPPAGELKTVGVVGVGGVDRLLEDAEYAGNLAGMLGLSDILKAQASQATGSEEGLPGIDTARPAGVIVQTDGTNFLIYGFVPVSDLAAALAAVEPNVMSITSTNGVHEIKAEGLTVYVQEKNGWAIIAQDQNTLQQASGAPDELLDGITDEHDIAAKVWVQNVPQMYRIQVPALLQMGMQQGLEPEPGESEEMFQARSEMVQNSIQQLQMLLDSLDTMTLGLSLDEGDRAASLAIETEVIPDSPLGEQIALNADLKTRFIGFAPDDAMVMIRETAKAGSREVEQVQNAFKLYRVAIDDTLKKDKSLSKREREHVEGLVNTLFDGFQKTIEEGQLDFAITATTAGNRPSALMAMEFLAARDLETQIRDMLEAAAEDDASLAEALTLDAETYQGYTLHTLTVSADQVEDEDFRRIMGDSVGIVLAFADDTVCVGFGPNAVADLKAALDASQNAGPTAVPQVEMYLALKPLLEFIRTLPPDEAEADMPIVDSLLAEMGDADRITVVSEIVDASAGLSRMTVVLQEDVLKAIGIGISQAMQAMGPGMMGPPGEMPPGAFPGDGEAMEFEFEELSEEELEAIEEEFEAHETATAPPGPPPAP